MDYKQSLLMGKSNFEMRGNLNQKNLYSLKLGKMKIFMKR